MSFFQHYRFSQVGLALQEIIDEMIEAETMDEDTQNMLLLQFDKVRACGRERSGEGGWNEGGACWVGAPRSPYSFSVWGGWAVSCCWGGGRGAQVTKGNGLNEAGGTRGRRPPCVFFLCAPRLMRSLRCRLPLLLGAGGGRPGGLTDGPMALREWLCLGLTCPSGPRARLFPYPRLR